MTRIVSWLVLASLAATPAWAADEKTTLQQLLADNQSLTVELAKAQKAKGEIAKAALANEGAQRALEGARRDLKQRSENLIDRANQIQTRAQQSGCPWGATSTDLGFVNACNEEGRRLTAMLDQVKKDGGGIQQMQERLDAEQNRLSEAELKRAAKQKANNAEIEELATLRQAWVRQYNAFVFHSETYERLKRMAPQSTICSELPLQSGAFGNAADCLHWLWDGAGR